MRITFPMALFLVFLVLKLTDYIAWSWLWVSAPLWIPLGVAAAFYAVALVITGIVWLASSPEQRKRNKAANALEKYGRSFRK